MATEQGSRAVETGVLRSQVAGDAIRQLADSIDDSAHAASQIAVSAQQQLAGWIISLGGDDEHSVRDRRRTSTARGRLNRRHNLHGARPEAQGNVSGAYRSDRVFPIRLSTPTRF